MSAKRHSTFFLLGSVALVTLVGCAQMPQAYLDLHWNDARGDRSSQVMVRDFAMCEKLVEQRSQLKGCMSARGWDLAPD